VEWHQREAVPRVGFIVTNLGRKPSNVTGSTTRGEGEQWNQGGEAGPFLDRGFFLHEVHLQIRCVCLFNAGLQPRELHEEVRSSEDSVPLVPQKRPAQARQDRCEGHSHSRRHLPVRVGRSPCRAVRRPAGANPTLSRRRRLDGGRPVIEGEVCSPSLQNPGMIIISLVCRPAAGPAAGSGELRVKTERKERMIAMSGGKWEMSVKNRIVLSRPEVSDEQHRSRGRRRLA